VKKTAAFLLSFSFFTAIQSQTSIKEYVQQTVVPIQTVQPDATDYSDLEAIGNAIGDAQIVMLGEQDHGDAPTYLAKTRLVKYLHEKKGFNVLAVESDFYALNLGWGALPKDSANIAHFLTYNIWPIWTGCEECFSLFRQYVPATFQTAAPLQVTGFDNQLIMPYSQQLENQLDSVLRSWQLPVTTTPEYTTIFIPMIDSLRKWWYSKPVDTLYDQCMSWLQRVRQEAVQKVSPNDFWVHVIDNLIEETKHFHWLKDKKKNDGHNVRDLQMAGNLAWLYKVKYPNEKIIVWAASQHIGKVVPGMPGNRLKLTQMGGAFTSDPAMAAITYVIGFTSYEGTAGRMGFPDYTVATPKKESFENWVRSKGSYSFVDFKAYQRSHTGKHEQFHMSGHNHYNVAADWTSIYDGVFYIDKMYTCKNKVTVARR